MPLASAAPSHVPLPVLDEAGLDLIEALADRVLAEVGLAFEGDPGTLALWREAGMDVQGTRVRLDGPRLREVVRRHAPARVRLRGRNPARDVVLGAGEAPVCAPVYGPPSVLLEDGSRAGGSLALYRELVALAHASPGLSCTGHMICVPFDVPERARPHAMALAHLTLSDKPCMGTVASPGAAEAVMDMAALAVGRPPEPGACDLLHLLNATPPLTYHENPLRCLRAVARRGQGLVVTSYMMMGATAPATIAGALAQGYAEALAGLALAQLWRPGAPVVLGLFAVPFSMSHMVPAFGDPATQLVQACAVQIGRRLGIPVRGDGGVSSSKLDDAQAGYEGAWATEVALAAGADFILHAAGWLEQGRCLSVAKLGREAAQLARGLAPGAPDCGPPLALDPAVEARLRGMVPG